MSAYLKRSKKIILSIVAIFAVVLFAWLFWPQGEKSALAGWWNDNWSYRKQVTINSEQVAGDLNDFPALISLTDSKLGDHAQPDGDDIVFLDAQGHTLSHEIESFASSTGKLVAWVRIPDLSATDDTHIYMYYGNASVQSQEDTNGVWDKNYKMVQHLEEGGTGTRYDSTQYGNHGDTNNYKGDEAITSAKINGADEFDEMYERIYCGQDKSLDINDTLTLEFWVKAASSTQPNPYVGIIRDRSDNRGWTPQQFESGPDIYMRVDTSAGANQSSQAIPDVLNDQWHHIVWILDNGARKGYKDGVKIVDDTYDHGSGFNSTSTDLIINPGEFFGTLDEVRVSEASRSAAWIATSYNNQNDPGAFLSAASEEVGPGPVGYWTFDEPSAGTGQAGGVHDESGQGNHGTNHGVVQKDDSMCVSGKCMYFKGQGDGDGYVEIEWKEPANDRGSAITSYHVYRGSNQMNMGIIDSVDPSTHQYNDTEVGNGLDYFYSVTAENGERESQQAMSVIGSPRRIISIPSSPTALEVEYVDNTVIVSWSPPDEDGGSPITKYYVERIDPRGSVREFIFDSDITSFVDDEIEEGMTYSYIVYADNEEGRSSGSDPVDVVIPERTNGEDEKNLLWLWIGVIVLILVIILILVYVMRRSKEGSEENDHNDEEE